MDIEVRRRRRHSVLSGEVSHMQIPQEISAAGFIMDVGCQDCGGYVNTEERLEWMYGGPWEGVREIQDFFCDECNFFLLCSEVRTVNITMYGNMQRDGVEIMYDFRMVITN